MNKLLQIAIALTATTTAILLTTAVAAVFGVDAQVANVISVSFGTACLISFFS